MKIQLSTKTLAEGLKGTVVVPVFLDEPPKIDEGLIKEFWESNPKFGKLYETQALFGQKEKYLLVGLGDPKKIDFQKIQNWAGTAAKNELLKSEDIYFVLPELSNFDESQLIQALVIGLELAEYDPSFTYKSKKSTPKLKNAYLLVGKADRSYSDGLKKGVILSESINLARRLGDMPSNEMTPSYFLSETKKVARENKLVITILDEKKASRLGLQAFVSVAKGSNEPSYMIALEYKGDPRSKEKWGLVGKGVTFDSGGISIKPSEAMSEMKYDMCGAANVLGTIKAIAKMGVKTNVVAIMGVTENMPSGNALKPGDIVKSYSGKTIEVINTDAEGRMVLMDAVAWAEKNFKATKIIDLATLTLAIVFALGDYTTGLFANNDKFGQSLILAGDKVGEKYCQFPMGEEYDYMIESDIADITNTGHGGSPKAAGPITGAKFIQAGVSENIPWIHLDIAGTAWDFVSRPFRSKGATGIGIKTLVELILC